MARVYGLEHLGFLTLTFAEHITDPREAQKRYNSLRTGVLKKRYLDFVRVIERQKSGRIHYHLVVALGADIRTGFDFQAVKCGKYNSANVALRSEWAFWRASAPKYRFGRTELQPIKSNSAAISKYVGKYISKHIENRLPEDKGVRLVEYSKGARDGTTYFAWNCVSGWLWREKLRVFAAKHHCKNEEELKAVFGKRWSYYARPAILKTELSYWPTAEHMRQDQSADRDWARLISDDSVDIVSSTSEGRDWHKEVRAARNCPSTHPEVPTATGRAYKLVPSLIPQAVAQQRILRRFFHVRDGQADLPLHEKGKANSGRKRLAENGRMVRIWKA